MSVNDARSSLAVDLPSSDIFQYLFSFYFDSFDQRVNPLGIPNHAFSRTCGGFLGGRATSDRSAALSASAEGEADLRVAGLRTQAHEEEAGGAQLQRAECFEVSLLYIKT